jgi:putative molybdopterin biosynthesis protein
VAPSAITGYGETESSHSAVAQAVASGAADAGLGIAAAARARGLDFVPLLEEDYYLVCLKSALEEPAVRSLLRVLRDEAWQRALSSLAGYQPQRSGEILSLREHLPWWNYPRRKRKAQSHRTGAAAP